MAMAPSVLTGRVALATGLGQIVFTASLGFVLALVLGMDPVTSAYVAVALTFSSTIIIVKLLSDKREIDSLYGRIALGFLIVQDLAVVLAMVALSALGVRGDGVVGAWPGLLRIALGGAGLIVIVGLVVRYLADRLLGFLARSPELLITVAMSWAVFLAAVSDTLGFGKELGGLLAGVSFASSAYRDAVASRLASVRDFLLLFFFVALGSRLEFSILGPQLPAAVVLSLFVLIGNPLIVLLIMTRMGYQVRTGFMAGLTVAQISEFSLIFMAMGVTLRHVDQDAFALVTVVGLTIIALSTYMILNSEALYRRLEPLLVWLESRQAGRRHPDQASGPGRVDVILFGLGRFGTSLAQGLTAHGKSVLGVDFDPEALAQSRDLGIRTLYGDAGDPHLVEHLPLAGAAWVVIATPAAAGNMAGADPRLALVHALEAAGFAGRIAIGVGHTREIAQLRQVRVDLVLNPFADAADRAVERIIRFASPGETEQRSGQRLGRT